MSINSNNAGCKQLGMSLSKARNKLTRDVLFSLLKRHNENICVRCNKVIESVKELTMDHVEPWLHVNPELYWNVSNIKFAHKKCNSGARRSRKKYPDKQAQQRAAWHRFYEDPKNKEKHLAQRRETYKKNKVPSSNGKETGSSTR